LTLLSKLGIAVNTPMSDVAVSLTLQRPMKTH
jgi:hypothetical protein